MGELSRQIDREDAKKFVPVSFWLRGPVFWLLIAVAIAALLKLVGADIQFLEQVPMLVLLCAGAALLCIWIIVNIRISLAVGGDENTPID